MKRLQIPLVTMLLAGLAANARAQVYLVTDLGTLDGPAFACAVNNAGQAAGASIDTVPMQSPYRAVIWDSVLNVINPIGSDIHNHAFAIDDAGNAYGVSFTIGTFDEHAFVADASGPSLLGNFTAKAVNSIGQIVGSQEQIQPTGWHTRSACLYDNGTIILLPALGGLNSRAIAIADNGDIVGSAGITGDLQTHAVLWRNGIAHDLGTLGGDRSQATAINNNNLIAGYAQTTSGDAHACAFQVDANGTVIQRTDLGTLGNSNYSYALGINDAGQIVGTSDNHAFLWDGSTMIDLNDHLPQNSGWLLQAAAAISENGLIVGWGIVNGQPSAYMLRLCPADFNGDGVIDTQDVLAFLNAWTAGETSADINGDGTIDTQDVLAFLNLWTSGCA